MAQPVQPVVPVQPTQVLVPTGIAPFPQGTTQLTQANVAVQPVLPPEVVHRLSFSSETVKRLTAADFNLGSKELITLKYDDCLLVLFHVENTESYQLANVWALAAQQVAGPVFAAINLLSERKVAEAFTRLKSDGSNPLHWASLRQYPFILVYRSGWPVAIYNGAREVQAIIDYALTLACQAGYYEPLQVGGSMQAEGRIEMGPYDIYTNLSGQPPRVRTESTQYNAENPIRGFNPNIPVVITGSPEAAQATSAIQAEEARRQATPGVATSLTEQVEGRPTLPAVTGEVSAAQSPPLAPVQTIPAPELALPAAPGTPVNSNIPSA